MTAPFSNGHEWDCWSSQWCQCCLNDFNSDCELIAVAVLEQRTPSEWTPGTDDLYDRYHCSKFRGFDYD